MLDTEGLDKVERIRLEMLVNVRGMMERGEISRVPEELERGGKRERIKIGKHGDAVTGDIQQAKKEEKAVTHEEAEDDDFFESD